MRINSLLRYDIPEAVIDLWRHTESEELLPLQERAVKRHDLFGDGNLLIQAPTSSGKTFRLRDRGVLNRRTNQRGDQYVEVQIVVPAIPDENTKALMREYEKLNTDDPRKKLFEQVD